MLMKVCSKLQERCPLKYSFLCALTCMDPEEMVSNDNVRTSFQTVTRKLVAAKIRTPQQCDVAEQQFGKLIRDEKESLGRFNPTKERLDEYYHSLLSSKDQYQELWQIVRIILTLSHGQASVERNFSINDDILLPNMKADTLCAIKTVHDAMMSTGIPVHQFQVPDKMLTHCGQARARYDLYQLEEQTKKEKESQKRKAQEMEEEYIQAKKKLKLLEDGAKSLFAAADKKAQESLKKHGFTFLAQSVAMRDKGNETLKSVKSQEKKVQELQSKLVQ